MPSTLPRPGSEYQGRTKQLTPDEQTLLARELLDESFAASTLREVISADANVPLDLAFNILAVQEHRMAVLCRVLGLELDSAAARDTRYAALRAANAKVRELQLQLGQEVQAPQGAAFLQAMGTALTNWWDEHGFGHLSDIRFNKWGSVECALSCHLSGRRRPLSSEKPVSRKEAHASWLLRLRDEGYQLYQEHGEPEPELLDCDVNRAKISELIHRHLPSAKLTRLDSRFNREGVATLNKLELFVEDLQDLQDLVTRSPSTAVEVG